MAEFPLFRRIILGLHPGAIDREAVEFVAETANLLGAALQGVFVENEAASAVGGFAYAREFQLVEHEWRPAETERITEDMRLAANSAKRLLDEAARALGIASFFEVLRGEPGSAVTNFAHPSDILVIATPKSPQERLAPSYPQLAFSPGSSMTTMLLPRRIRRRKGPVVVLVETPQDSSLAIAVAIARAANERLLLIAPRDGPLRDAIMAAARDAGAEPNNVALVTLPCIDTHVFLSALERTRERLIVLPRSSERSAGEIDPSLVAAMRSAPVILAGPAAAPES
jgi:hypothetical protein